MHLYNSIEEPDRITFSCDQFLELMELTGTKPAWYREVPWNKIGDKQSTVHHFGHPYPPGYAVFLQQCMDILCNQFKTAEHQDQKSAALSTYEELEAELSLVQ